MTVLETYGQASDSVTISTGQFFAMERMRRDYSLLKVQFLEIQKSNQAKQGIIDAKDRQLKVVALKFEASEAFTKELKKKYRKKKFSNTLLKISVPLVFISGVYLGTQAAR